jgi:hypothetical protein
MGVRVWRGSRFLWPRLQSFVERRRDSLGGELDNMVLTASQKGSL